MGNFQEATIYLHATTLATNAILTRTNIPKLALLITKGFKNIIEIARHNRPRLYDLFLEKLKPFVDRNMRFEMDERTDYRGEIIKEVNEKELNNAFDEGFPFNNFKILEPKKFGGWFLHHLAAHQMIDVAPNQL